MRKSFKATCKLPAYKPVQDLTEADEKVRSSTAVKHKGEWCALVPHDHEFTDPYLFDQHMLDVHGAKLGAFRDERAAWTRHTLPKIPPRMWRAARLTEDGTPFAPEDLKPGAAITWTQDVPTGETVRERRYDHEQKRDVWFDRAVTEQVERSGQVWSGGPYPRTVWVIPFELLADERVVLVGQDRDGAICARRTWTVRDARRTAA